MQADRDERHSANLEVTDWDKQAERYCKGELKTSFVAVAAFVTAYARQKMNYYRAVAGEGNCWYQGVDSLIVNNRGQENLEQANLISESELGKLRLQLTANYGYIAGCSDYKVADKIVLSGYSRNITSEERRQGLQRTFSAKPYLFTGKPLDSVTEELSEWRKCTSYWKGTIGQDGTVAPLVLPLEKDPSSIPDKFAAMAASASAVTVST
jgi:hypothetical protein